MPVAAVPFTPSGAGSSISSSGAPARRARAPAPARRRRSGAVRRLGVRPTVDGGGERALGPEVVEERRHGHGALLTGGRARDLGAGLAARHGDVRVPLDGWDDPAGG